MTFFWICFGLLLIMLGLTATSLATTLREYVKGKTALDLAYLDMDRASLRRIVQLECPICQDHYVATLAVGETQSECPNCKHVHEVG